MATLVSGNRNDLKKCFNKMLYEISVHDLDEIDLSVDLFESLALKYCIARNQDFEVFQKALKGIKHSLTHFVTPRRRTHRLYEQMQELHKLFVKSEKGISLPNKLKMISEDLAYDLSLLFEAEGDFDPTSIFDSFESLIELGDDIRKEGYEVYQIYRQLIRNVGVVKSYVPAKSSKTDQPRPADIKTLKQFMAPVFSTLDDIVTTFSEPEAPPKKSDKKKDEKYTHLDADTLHKEAKHSEAMRLIFGQNWTPQNAARHLNMTITELLDILGVEIESEEGEEKKEVPEADDTKKDKSIVDDKE